VRLQVKGKNVEVSDQIRAYAEEKLARLERHLDGPTRVELELTVERNPSIAAGNVAEATIWTKGPVLRAREASADMRASIDQLADKLERQVTRYRDKRRRHGTRDRAPDPGAGSVPTEDGDQPTIVKAKQFAVKPMSPEEAALQLELVGHDFFVFRNGDSSDLNVVYRRRAGGYGLIEPE
jgi:putative sigma-54 modulation protein